MWADTSLPAVTSPTKVVTDLYRAHNGKTDPLQYPASKKLLGAYFEKGLLSLFLKDQSESQGEVGKLDFDPLYAPQDFEIKNFSVALVAQQKGFGRGCGILQKYRDAPIPERSVCHSREAAE